MRGFKVLNKETREYVYGVVLTSKGMYYHLAEDGSRGALGKKLNLDKHLILQELSNDLYEGDMVFIGYNEDKEVAMEKYYLATNDYNDILAISLYDDEIKTYDKETFNIWGGNIYHKFEMYNRLGYIESNQYYAIKHKLR